jgi:hypothetical protein
VVSNGDRWQEVADRGQHEIDEEEEEKEEEGREEEEEEEEGRQEGSTSPERNKAARNL